MNIKCRIRRRCSKCHAERDSYFITRTIAQLRRRGKRMGLANDDIDIAIIGQKMWSAEMI
ncbi:hypothetical protein LCGC14_1242320 [marine sediment metagenome]|uniref:Uncharacterized protein n=1 Tax=marine sediment metagenome TaxID=412755 RepID=A0A0F9LSP2_9ZZZZ